MRKLLIAATVALLCAACGNKTTGNTSDNDSDDFMLDGPGSVYVPEEGNLDEATSAAIEASIKERVAEIYKEVNRRWDPDYMSKQSERTLEELYTTKNWQEVFNHVRAIERTMTGSDENHFFVEGGNIWTMGSYDAPFKVSGLAITLQDENAACASFSLCPAESEGVDVVWEMVVEDGEWRINNVIDDTADFDTGESEPFDYMEHMQAYIKEYKK